MPRPNYRRIPLAPLSGGVRTNRHPTRIADGESPDATNVEFGADSVKSCRGSRKLNNQTLLRPGVRCQPDPAYSPLYVEAGKSVPLRGRIDWPHDPATDIGSSDLTFGGTFGSPTFHNRRGRSFERQLSFRIPETFRMQERPARGEGAPNPGNTAIENGCGYDEGLEDCTILWQKGGEGLAPMSWAIGIVNAGNWAYTAGVTAKARRSNYFLVFMWLDAPEWGVSVASTMRYDLATYANNATGAYCTQALRAFILDGRDDAGVAYALEPGRSYNVSVAVTLDSLTGGTTWAHDGRVDVRLQEQHGRLWTGSFVDSGGGGTATNLTVWKGPTDSLRYLAKFGIRYSGRDMEFGGLGYRGAPWEELGWLPFGHDSSSMETKGFRFADISLNSITDLYGSIGYALTCTHPVAGNTYLSVNTHRGLTENAGAAGLWARSPWGPRTAGWGGYGGPIDDTGAPASNFNSQALRGYRVVFPRSADGTMNALRGGCMTIEGYSEVALNDYRLEVQDAESLGVTWAGEQPFLIRAFRWNQQAIDLQEMRCWASSRDYANPRVQWSMTHSLELDDETEPELSKLQAYLPLSDGGGRVCRELVRGNHALFAPFGLPLVPGGSRGKQMLYLSGDGDALVYDLSENPVFAREMKALLASNSRGFAIELTCILPQAYYGIATLNAAGARPNEYEAAYCPDIVSWALKEADEAGAPSQALPLLTMGHHSWWQQGIGTTPERRPQGFHVDVSAGLDSEQAAMQSALVGFTRSVAGAGLWDDATPWVGKRITIQVGVQPSPDNRNGVANMGSEFRVYIAATPKGALKYATGEDPQAEFAYFADVTIQKKDLPRLVVTIGGGWNPQLVRGYTEYSCRLLVDEVRVYGATAAGELPATSGLVTGARRGKILGRNSLPQRELGPDDVVQPLGVGTRAASLVEGSAVVMAPGGTSFFTEKPEDTNESVREKFLVAQSDVFRKPSLTVFQEEIQEFYWIPAVAASGASLTLATPYNGPASPHASAGVTNLAGYTNFDVPADELVRAPLSLGSGAPYKPGTTRTADLVLSSALFANGAAIDGEWKVRIASPFTEGGLATVLPRWVRGIVSPRRGRVSGIQALDSTIFATTQGSIARVDDRWRENGPTRTLRTSLAFQGKTAPGHEQRWPLAFDAARFARYENAWPYWSTTISRDFTWVYDFWIELDEYAGLQTLLWLGCDYSHLLLGPAATDERRGIGIWLRLNDGRAEIVRESLGNFAGGGAPPPDGRYVATAAERVPLGRWTHVRFWLEHQQSGGIDVVRLPGISINGRRTTVGVNAQETGLSSSSDWIRTNNGGGLIGSLLDTRNTLLLGAARDAVRAGSKSQFAALSQLGGREFQGGRLVGLAHPLVGRMADAVVWRAARTDPLVVGYPDFDPFTLNYGDGRFVRFRTQMQEGIGEHLLTTATEVGGGVVIDSQGVVLSHPAIDLYNELGPSEQAPSFAVAEQRVFVVNGGRPAYVTERGGGPAGILPPTTRPRVVIERKPLWEPNVNLVDPVAAAAVGAGVQIHHYSTFGNNYLRQRWHEDMRWAKDDAAANTPFDILGFKCYWKPNDVAGTIPIRSARSSRDSGGIFLECVDGKARLGWYDTELKAQVYVTSSAPIFRPGYWYYIFLRKAFPLQDTQEGNWFNSFYAQGQRRRANFTLAGTWAVGDLVRNAGVTKRGLVTKVYAGTIEYVLFDGDTDFVATEAVNNGGAGTGTITATPFANTGDSLVIRELQPTNEDEHLRPLWYTKSSVRSAVSFTSEMPRSPFTTAVGQLTPKGALFTGAAGGVVNVATLLGKASPLPIFTDDMIGMQWQFSGAAANTPEKVYRVASVPSAVQIVVEDEYGNNPNLAGFVNLQGGVFAGLELVKSERFDDSKMPDQGNYDTEIMGTALASDPANGYTPFSGRMASFAWAVVSSNISATAFYSGFDLFETATPLDLMQKGTDSFTFQLYHTGGRPGELHVDAGKCFMCVDTQPYGLATVSSTQPNSALAVAKDAEADADAESLYWKALQEARGWSGRRVVYVAFYDADQDVRSNPGPRLVVEVQDEDTTNPSGMARLLLTDIPISHQPGRIERHVFVTDADGLVPFRGAIIPDNRASSVGLTLDDNQIDRSDILEFDNSPPPNCSALAISQGVMFFGDVEVSGVRERNAILYSKPFLTMQVPFANFHPLISGSNERVVGMTDLNGVLLVWKKDAMFEATVVQGAVIDRGKSTNVGLVGPQAFAVLDQDAYWIAFDRGLYVYFGSGGPVWLGEAIGDLFDGDNAALMVDGRELERASVAINRRLDQVVATWKAVSESDQRRRFSIEFDAALSGAGLPGDPTNGWRYALYAGPNATALGSADRSVPGAQRFLAGTAEGFLAELDRAGAALELHEPGLVTQATLTAGSTTTKLVLASSIAGVFDLEGLRGVPVAWAAARATILFADATNLYLDRAVAAAPASGTVISIGAVELSWSSKVFSLGNPEERKIPEYLDLTLARQGSGEAVVEAFVDANPTALPLRVQGVNTTTPTMDLTQLVHRIPLSEIRGQYVQFRVRVVPPAAGVELEVLEAVLRVSDGDLH